MKKKLVLYFLTYVFFKLFISIYAYSSRSGKEKTKSGIQAFILLLCWQRHSTCERKLLLYASRGVVHTWAPSLFGALTGGSEVQWGGVAFEAMPDESGVISYTWSSKVAEGLHLPQGVLFLTELGAKHSRQYNDGVGKAGLD
ncbi:hypothetical protein DM02DRAFT_326825 [Periconia macrospinosa]|uniref:Uncharacterized protein n=1 Tax=Periconia macrospinosa TaxID=97972 RepID=A0A2V1EBL6_9PLEO|nr:hypothetical protein DM02DRAFT_326825 [Periconia macrospinosa]